MSRSDGRDPFAELVAIETVDLVGMPHKDAGQTLGVLTGSGMSHHEALVN